MELRPRPQGRVPDPVIDALLGVAVALVISTVIAADLGGSRRPDLVAYSFAVGFGALMLVRRQLPCIVLVATTLMLFSYYTLGYPPIGLAVPVAAALYSAAEEGRAAAAVAAGLVLLLVSTYFRLRQGESARYLLGYELVSTVAIMAAAIALGDRVRTGRRLRQAFLLEKEREAERIVRQERVRLARDLHDAVGHHLSVVALHSNVAREALEPGNEAAEQALSRVTESAGRAMRELRATVKLLRDDAQRAERHVLSVSSLEPLLEGARANGLTVDLSLDGEVGALPSEVETTVFRIVQESLTNVLRHARARHAEVTIARSGRTLELSVADDGLGGADGLAGHGIEGMRERAKLVDGELTAGPRRGGGFEVRAVLPLREMS